MEQTLALIKPDAINNLHTGAIIDLIERNGFHIAEMEKIQLTIEEAREFYEAHREKPFFNELVDYITSGPIVAIILEKENAIADWRTLMGATNPDEAAIGTLRTMFGTHIGSNAVHGSDSPETADREINFFFPEYDHEEEESEADTE